MLQVGDIMEAKLEKRVSTADVRVGGNIDNVVNAEYVFYSGPTPPSDNGGGLNGTNRLQPASNYGIGGGGYARKIPETNGLIERFRYDAGHKGYEEPHLNYHSILDTSTDSKPIVDNKHIEGLE